MLLDTRFRNTLLGVMGLFFVLDGCTSSRIIAPHSPGAQRDTLDLAEVQESIRDRNIQLFLVDKQQINGSDAIIGADSLRLSREEDRAAIGVPLDSIRTVEWRDHVSGLVGGFFAGAVVGGTAGWAIGSATSHGDLAGLGVAVSTLGGAVLGAVAGTLLGGVPGRRVIYRFPPGSDAAHQPESGVDTMKEGSIP
jgi:hypothetical protein